MVGATEKHSSCHWEIAGLNPYDATDICGWDNKIGHAVWVRGTTYSHSLVNHSSSQSWMSVNSCMWKRFDNAFFQMCCIALIQ